MPRPTTTEISLGAIEYNFNLIRHLVGDQVKILSVVKANAYSHGIKEVSKKLVQCGTDYLGVATVDEAVDLKKFLAKIKLIEKNVPILVLGAILPDEVDTVLRYGIVQTVADKDIVVELSKKAKRHGKKAKVHIKIDT